MIMDRRAKFTLLHAAILCFILLQMSPSYVSCLNPGYLETYPRVQESNGTTPLYFGLIMSFPGGEFDSSGAIAGVRVALDRINNDPMLLPDYTLHYTLTNSSVSLKFQHDIKMQKLCICFAKACSLVIFMLSGMDTNSSDMTY